jgi:hypothetical protein
MQQGRVQLDADWNEQQAITQHRDEALAADVIGPTGAPRERPGFAITPQGADLQIGAGHFYVDGVLCENEADVLFSAQPDLRPIDQPLLPAAAGLYVAYLDVWQRHITALEDGQIRETALGGPDSTTRSRTVWQVRLLPVTDPGGTVTCDTVFPEWDGLLAENLIGIANPGRMSAQAEAEEPVDDPLCVLPPSAGYRRLENQLYRVEIHRGGDRTQARFKWSRDNGTVVSAIEPDAGGVVVSGSEIVVHEIGRDDFLSFAADPLPEWLELTDDRYELLQQHGTLARVQTVDPNTRTITFAAGALPALDAAQHPIVRRWDQRGATATTDGVAMTGDWQALEDGVQIRFEDGIYREGDHWLIPARTALGLETGRIEWPRAGGVPVAELPHGTRHHLARLAVLRRNGGGFTMPPDGDCRRVFPSLTGITAADVSFSDATCNLGDATNVQEALDILCRRNASICTLLVSPGDDLAAAVAGLPAGQDAMICLRAGTYQLNAPVRIENRGNVQVMGCGPASRLVAPTSEAALIFSNCTSVVVRDCHFEGGLAGRGAQPTTDLNGALTFLNCRSVTVQAASLRCAGGPLRAATCVTVRHTAPAAGSQARIEGCDLEVGHIQAGVLLVNVDRIRVTDNLLRAGGRPSDVQLLQDADYRGALRRQLISGVQLAGAPPAGTNATVTFNAQVVHFRTDPALIRGNRNDTEWQRAINAINPPNILSPNALQVFLQRLAGQLLASRGEGQGGSALFRTTIAALLAQDTAVASQGIVVGGTLATDVQVTGNTVRDAMQGVHIGLSQSGGRGIRAGVVTLRDNTIRVSLPTSAARERHAIYVGNCGSLAIEGNVVSLVRATRNATLRVEGIRLFGDMGARVIVRHNHLGPAFAVGIVFAPLNAPLPPRPLWIITENIAESAAEAVRVPARGEPGGGVANTAQVRQRVRGIADNFA